jgi:hypothetical protein
MDSSVSPKDKIWFLRVSSHFKRILPLLKLGTQLNPLLRAGALSPPTADNRRLFFRRNHVVIFGPL